MEITVHLPDDLSQHPDPGREALESLVIEGYRSGAFSHYQASHMLGLSRIEFDGFLKARKIYDHAYDVQALEEDIKTVRADMQRRLNQYTAWLRECAAQEKVAIEPADNGPYRFQWNIYSTVDARSIGHITMEGLSIVGSDTELRQRLCRLLSDKLRESHQPARLH